MKLLVLINVRLAILFFFSKHPPPPLPTQKKEKKEGIFQYLLLTSAA